MAVLFTFGASDLGTASVRPDARGQLNIYTSGTSNVLGMVNIGRIKPVPYIIYGPNTPQPKLRLPLKPSLVFNQISEPDSHSVALQRCVELCDMLGVPVVNDPRKVQENSRDKVASLLQGIEGAQVPKTIACTPRSPAEVYEIAEEHGIALPFIFRTAGEHNGFNMIRLEHGDPLDERLHAFPFDGRKFYMIEFVDYRDHTGMFRKHRVSIIDGDIFGQHHSFHEHWKVHVAARDGMQFMASHSEMGTAEENLRDLVENRLPKAEPVFREIARRIGLDYLVVDCHVREDGSVVVFEANSNVNALENIQDDVQHYIDRITARMSRLIAERSGESL